jgi:hypothetical protein
VRYALQGFIMLRNIATKTIYAVTATVVATVLSAQVNAQTIIVDGVTYQAVPTLPAAQVMPAPVAYPVQTAAMPVTSPTYQQPTTYTNTNAANAANVVVTLFVAAIGLWALSDWMKPEQRGYRHRPAHAPAVYSPPSYGAYHHQPR